MICAIRLDRPSIGSHQRSSVTRHFKEAAGAGVDRNPNAFQNCGQERKGSSRGIHGEGGPFAGFPPRPLLAVINPVVCGSIFPLAPDHVRSREKPTQSARYEHFPVDPPATRVGLALGRASLFRVNAAGDSIENSQLRLLYRCYRVVDRETGL